ncbi:hypothetical protein [Collimonas silvisoli]|nr:hypothetical protein [Collimonas silvisoli]
MARTFNTILTFIKDDATDFIHQRSTALTPADWPPWGAHALF